MSESLFPVVGEPSEAFTGPIAWPEISSEPPDDGDLPAIALSPWAKDLAGQKFGRLTALRPVGKLYRNLVWLCQCSCGCFTKTKGSFLINGHTKSCGCFHRERSCQSKLKNLQGQRFCRLTVIELAGMNKQGRYSWRCLCDCGKTVIVTSANLIQGETKSCGCIRTEKNPSA